MIKQLSVAAALAVGAAGCEQISQSLPFQEDATQPVTRTVAASGGAVNSGAGGSVVFPAGALGEAVGVTITPTAAAAGVGTAAASHSFRIDPAGTTLLKPASVELAIDGRRDDSWLTSILLRSGDSTFVVSDAQLDLTLGTVRGEIDRLGTVTAITPPSSAIVQPGRIAASGDVWAARDAGASFSLAPARIFGACNTAVAPCAGQTIVDASDEILNLVDRLGIVFPRYGVDLQLGIGTPGLNQESVHPLTGSGAFSATIRGRAGRSGTSTRFLLSIRAEAASRAVRRASQITLQNVRVVVSQCAGADDSGCVVKSNRVVDVVVNVASPESRLVLEAEGFQFNNRPARLRVQLPLTVQ
jgi:hypothetical protein